MRKILQKRDAVLRVLRTQFRARVREIIFDDGPGSDRVEVIVLASRRTEIDPRLETLLLDTANNIMQVLAEDDVPDDVSNDPTKEIR